MIGNRWVQVDDGDEGVIRTKKKEKTSLLTTEIVPIFCTVFTPSMNGATVFRPKSSVSAASDEPSFIGHSATGTSWS